MISVNDHLIRGTNNNGIALWPGLRVHGFPDWDEEKRFDYICDSIMPWYIRYMSGWYNYCAESIVFYEEMVHDPLKYFNQVGRVLELSEGSLDINSVKKGGNTRFNVGSIGRGQCLVANYKSRLQKYVSYHAFGKNILSKNAFDFSRVGL